MHRAVRIILFLGLVPLSVLASRVSLTGFEGGLAPCSSTSGTLSVNTTTKNTGRNAMRTNPSTTAVGFCRLGSYAINTGLETGFKGTDGVATAYYKFYFRVATLPAAKGEEIFEAKAISGTTLKGYVLIDSAGNIGLYDSVNTQEGATSSTALSTGTWYRIEIKIGTAAAGAGAGEVKINGVSEITTTTGTFTTSNNTFADYGKVTNRGNQSVDFYYDDIAVDDAEYPGASEVKSMSPNANGSVMQWNPTGCSGLSYEMVDEYAPVTTCYALSTAQNDVALFDFETTASTSISGTINGFITPQQGRENVAGNSSYILRISDGTAKSTTGVDPGSAGDLGMLSTTTPDGGGAWTTADLDDVEAGAVDADGAPILRIEWIMIEVDYTPSVGGGDNKQSEDLEDGWFMLFDFVDWLMPDFSIIKNLLYA